jgi:hypothetical protein
MPCQLCLEGDFAPDMKEFHHRILRKSDSNHRIMMAESRYYRNSAGNHKGGGHRRCFLREERIDAARHNGHL